MARAHARMGASVAVAVWQLVGVQLRLGLRRREKWWWEVLRRQARGRAPFEVKAVCISTDIWRVDNGPPLRRSTLLVWLLQCRLFTCNGTARNWNC